MSTLLATSLCRHCGREFFASRRTEAFCCSGCAAVYAMIQDNGLGEFYKLRDKNPPVCPMPSERLSDSIVSATNLGANLGANSGEVIANDAFAYCDDPEFIHRASVDGNKMQFFVENLNCTACLWLLERLPTVCEDVAHINVNMSTSTVEVVRQNGGSFAAAARALTRLGYRAHALRDFTQAAERQAVESRRDLVRIGTAGALTGNIMILSVSVYGGATGSLSLQFAWLAALLSAPVLTYCAMPFYRSAWGALSVRRLNLDVPIVAAIAAGIVASAAALLNRETNVYFDSLSMLVFLLLSSRYLLKTLQTRWMKFDHLEDEVLCSTVDRVNGDQLTATSSLALLVGDVISVRQSMIVPVDAMVVSGHGLIDRAALTGESAAIAVEPGTLVEAGSRKISGDWRLSVLRTSNQSRLAQILKDTAAAEHMKPKTVEFADQISQVFVIAVFSIAALLLLGEPYFLNVSFSSAIQRDLAFVIVTCPCVFGMAIPLSMSLATRLAASRGIIVKDTRALETINQVRTAFFDKTGTLTVGEMQVLHATAREVEQRDFLLSVVVALECAQEHPVARALIDYAHSQSNVQPLKCIRHQMIVSGGVSASINGITYALAPDTNLINLNNDRHVYEQNGAIQASYRLTSTKPDQSEPQTEMQFQLGDQIRPEATALLTWLRAKSIETKMLSGDRSNVARSCARQLGFSESDVDSNATSEQKTCVVQKANESQPKGHATLMVGDGVNDAGALASASIGIAMSGAMEASLKSADVYMMQGGLTSIRELFEIAAATRKAIRRNLLFSVAFNLVSGTLAATGRMSPLWAAVVMPLSSFSVLGSSVLAIHKIKTQLSTRKTK
jgi:Cu2+-exporting ATPase/Cu+-exporting ATPase